MMGLLAGDKKKDVSLILEGQGELKPEERKKESYDEKRPHNNMEDEMYGNLMAAFQSGDSQKLKKAFNHAFEYSYMKLKK